MHIHILDNTHKFTRKGKYHNFGKSFYASVNLAKNEYFCRNPYLYLSYWRNNNYFRFGIGDYDDFCYEIELPFSITVIHEILNIMKDYEMAVLSFDEIISVVESIKLNFTIRK